MDATPLPGCRRNLKTAVAGGSLAIGLAVAAFAFVAWLCVDTVLRAERSPALPATSQERENAHASTASLEP